MGIFTDFLFFNHKATDALCGKLGLSLDVCDKQLTQAIYQFEARHFQYSVLRKNIRFVKDYRENNEKEYMIFRFGHVTQQNESVYGICQRNNRRGQQPWMCQHLLTCVEMLRFFNLDKEVSDIRRKFLDGIRIDSHYVTKTFDAKRVCEGQTGKICGTLEYNFYQYIKDLKARDDIENNNDNRK